MTETTFGCPAGDTAYGEDSAKHAVRITEPEDSHGPGPAVVPRERHARIPGHRIRPGTTLTERGGRPTMPRLPLERTV
jgi:hypothetical protein